MKTLFTHWSLLAALPRFFSPFLFKSCTKKLFLFVLAPAFLLLGLRQPGYGQGFRTMAQPYYLPPGGYATTSHNWSYVTPAFNASTTSATDHTWVTEDMDGDNRPDIVVITEGTGTYNEPFYGTGTSRYWKVYLNNGRGYNTTPVTWALPAGGHISSNGHLNSFDAYFYNGSTYTGDQKWDVEDINGDGRPDLVAQYEGNGSGYNLYGPNASSIYWKVYLNTGTGFAATATNWTLPAVGSIYSNNQKFTSTFDMNGDGRVDLLVYSENNVVYSSAGASYWKVFLNTGAGFSATATNWALPAGGRYDGFNLYGFNNLYYAGSAINGNQGWQVQDMNGDNKPDIAVLSQGDGTYSEPFGTGTTGRYWKVYLNTGTGYPATPTNWTLPAGGTTSPNNGHFYSFNGLAVGGSARIGDQSYRADTDLNGDLKPDLIVLSEGNGTSNDVYGNAVTGRYWKVYLSTGIGFATTAATWALPDGGTTRSNVSYSFGDTSNGITALTNSNTGDQSWTVADINGDSKADLIVFTEATLGYNDVFINTTGLYWKIFLNSATLPTRAASLPATLRLYPNPAHTTTTVPVPDAAGVTAATLTLTDMLGRSVRTAQPAPGSDYALDLTGLAPGVYIVQVQAGETLATQRLVVQ